MSRAFVSGPRIALMTTCVVVCFVVLMGKLFSLHVVQHERLAGIAEDNRRRMQVVSARRGDIVDARGNLLATTNAAMEIGVDPQALLPEDFNRIPELARLLGVSPELIHEKFTHKYREVDGIVQEIKWHKLADGIEEPVYAKIRELGVRAVYGNRQYRRIYPGGQTAAHVVGFINREDSPVTGVERYLDFYLKGQDGWRESERDGRRRELAHFRHREVDPTAGLHVELSMDSVIQHAAEEEVRRLVEEFKPKGVSIIVGEVSTGYILAMANYPTYDPNVFWEYDVDNHRNRSVTDVFEPGSTFKIVPVAAALNENLVTPDDVFDCSVSSVTYRNRSIRLPADHQAMGDLTVEQIMVKSSNKGVALLGMKLEERRLHSYSKGFGFGERTGFQPGPEVRGILHPISAWDGLTISRLPMGHAISATPLQVHTATGAVANGGILMEPQAVRRVFDQRGDTVVSFPPRARHRVVTAETASLVAGMLEKVVSDEGTARRAHIEDYRVAGKTGTTQKIIDGRYSNRHHVASFSGFFPVDRPRLVITVIVDEPEIPGSGYGGRVAAPAFKNLAQQCIRHLGIPPSQRPEPIVALGAEMPKAHAREDSSSPRRISTLLQ